MKPNFLPNMKEYLKRLTDEQLGTITMLFHEIEIEGGELGKDVDDIWMELTAIVSSRL